MDINNFEIKFESEEEIKEDKVRKYGKKKGIEKKSFSSIFILLILFIVLSLIIFAIYRNENGTHISQKDSIEVNGKNSTNFEAIELKDEKEKKDQLYLLKKENEELKKKLKKTYVHLNEAKNKIERNIQIINEVVNNAKIKLSDKDNKFNNIEQLKDSLEDLIEFLVKVKQKLKI